MYPHGQSLLAGVAILLVGGLTLTATSAAASSRGWACLDVQHLTSIGATGVEVGGDQDATGVYTVEYTVWDYQNQRWLGPYSPMDSDQKSWCDWPTQDTAYVWRYHTRLYPLDQFNSVQWTVTMPADYPGTSCEDEQVYADAETLSANAAISSSMTCVGFNQLATITFASYE